MSTVLCTGCQTHVSLDADDKCPNCGAKPSGTSTAEPTFTVRPALRPKVTPEVQMAIAVDRTGSMTAFPTAVKNSLPLIFDPVEAKARGLQVWLQTHGDRDEGQHEVLMTDGGTAAQALSDAATIVFEGGGDPPENHLDGIETILNRVPWNPNPTEARGAIVAITTADTKPAQSGRSAEDIGKAIKDKGIVFCLIGQPTPTLLELNKAASGFFFEISDNPSVDEMCRIADMVAASITASLPKLSATRPAPAPTV